MALLSLLEPVSFLPSMPYRSRTNPSFTKQAHLFRYPLFTKYNQQLIRTSPVQSMQKPHSSTTCHLDLKLKPDCLEFKNKNPNHVHNFLQMASESTEPLKKLFISVVVSAIPICYSYRALAASGGVLGGDCFSSYSSSSSSSSYSGSSSSPSSPSSSSSSPSSYSNSLSSYPYYKSKSSELSPLVTSSDSKYTMSTSVAPQPMSPKERLFWIAFVFSIFFVFIASIVIHQHRVYEENSGKTSVIKLQVALLGSDWLIQRDLNQIAKLANTSTQKGLKSILTESSLALLRHSASCVSSHLSTSEEQSIENGEKHFKRLSFGERRKFDQETLVNLDNFMKKQELRWRFEDLGHDFIVVTFLVAAVGILKLTSIESRADLTAIVEKLESIPQEEILAVQVPWTPQNETDTLSSQRVHKDYPLLRPLND